MVRCFRALNSAAWKANAVSETGLRCARRPLLQRLHLLPTLSLAAIAWLAACGAQEAINPHQPLPLGAPNATFPDDFGYVHTVRELSGGDVLVADPLGQALYRVEMEAGVRTRVGRMGEGPGEYGEPDAVWPLAGDSTLLVASAMGGSTGWDPMRSSSARSRSRAI